MQKTIILIIITLTLILPFSLIAQDKSEPPKLSSNFVYAAYSSLLPGLGQVKKDRMYTGIFIFSAFGASLYNLKLNNDNFHKARKEYDINIQNLNVLSTFLYQNSNSIQNLALSPILANQIYKGYFDASIEANNALKIVALVYIIQIGHAYFCSPGDAFKSSGNSNYYPQSNFSFSMYPNKNLLGQNSTDFQMNYTWRF